jgi:hypothetical protein
MRFTSSFARPSLTCDATYFDAFVDVCFGSFSLSLAASFGPGTASPARRAFRR